MPEPAPAPVPCAPTLPLAPAVPFGEAELLSGEHRALRNGHKGLVVWITGLSGAGKSTLSRALERALFDCGHHVYVLDGDELRRGLNSDLGYGEQDRHEVVRRAAEVASLLSKAGLIAITALISPFREDRRRAREIVEKAGGVFVETFVNAPLAVCEQRDVKGLYKRARSGEILNFTGISAPYEMPEHPDVSVCSAQQTVEESVATVFACLQPLLAPGGAAGGPEFANESPS